MALIDVDLPSPAALRGGWAALAAVHAARDWGDVYAEADQWLFHDGGGNWACLRFVEHDKILLVGHDHDYSETYFGDAANYFGMEETDLLDGAPTWWGAKLDPHPFGNWIGFVYGWNGHKWQRAAYDAPDGFEQLGLLEACSVSDTDELTEYAADAPGLQGLPPDADAIRDLVSADAAVTSALLQRVVPGWEVDVGAAAARKFLDMPV